MQHTFQCLLFLHRLQAPVNIRFYRFSNEHNQRGDQFTSLNCWWFLQLINSVSCFTRIGSKSNWFAITVYYRKMRWIRIMDGIGCTTSIVHFVEIFYLLPRSCTWLMSLFVAFEFRDEGEKNIRLEGAAISEIWILHPFSTIAYDLSTTENSACFWIIQNQDPSLSINIFRNKQHRPNDTSKPLESFLMYCRVEAACGPLRVCTIRILVVISFLY